MEGTSGAAERALLRGGVREAALSGEPTAVGMLGAPARERRARGEFTRAPREWTRRRRCSSRRIVTSSRHEVSEPIGLGRSSYRERSRWEAPRIEAQRLDARPLARDLSAGCASERARRHPRLVGGPKGRAARAKLQQRATAGVVPWSSDGRGRARGSYRWQKSTGGARPISPTSEEHVDPEPGLAPPRESAARGERASEAGSSAAKRRDRWQLPQERRRASGS
jgi:hypothetical protein